MKKYSASSNGFYDEAINEVIPDDAVDITEDEWSDLLMGQSQGNVISSDKDGRPVLVEHTLTDEDKALLAESRKRELRAVADSVIAPLQDAFDDNIATEKESADLKAWRQYRVLLNRVNTSGDVAEGDWPVVPA